MGGPKGSRAQAAYCNWKIHLSQPIETRIAPTAIDRVRGDGYLVGIIPENVKTKLRGLTCSIYQYEIWNRPGSGSRFSLEPGANAVAFLSEPDRIVRVIVRARPQKSRNALYN